MRQLLYLVALFCVYALCSWLVQCSVGMSLVLPDAWVCSDESRRSGTDWMKRAESEPSLSLSQTFETISAHVKNPSFTCHVMSHLLPHTSNFAASDTHGSSTYTHCNKSGHLKQPRVLRQRFKASEQVSNTGQSENLPALRGLITVPSPIHFKSHFHSPVPSDEPNPATCYPPHPSHSPRHQGV